MRPVSPFHLSRPDLRALRTALAAGAVAGLAVIGACTDKNDTAITAPPHGPRNATIEAAPGVYAFATQVIVCVSNSSPVGTYKFTNSNFRRASLATGGDGTSSENNPDWNSVWTPNTLFKVAVVPPALGNRTADAIIDPTGDIQEVTTQGTSKLGAPPAWNATTGGTTTDGTVVWTNRGPAEYEIAKGACQTVLTRNVADSKYCSTGAGLGGAGGPEPACGQPDAVNVDSFTGIVLTATTFPGTYDHTDCEVDDGVKDPKDAGGANTNGNNPVVTNNPCDTDNNPTTAFANIAHGTRLTFFFNAPTGHNCTFTQGYYKNHESYTASVLSGNAGTTYIDGTGNLLIGAYALTAAQVDAILGAAVGHGYNAGGVTFTKDQLSMIHQLITAELNVAGGAAPATIVAIITAANNYIGASKTQLSGWTKALDDFNKGSSGPGHCS